ncbi:RraA family protein [Saccharospirillum salsuginis]|uniref:Putative 4-hydroxy-4-methyl-2-oxoglutarate aldolase n=1 Tax=Saccharospirillum salsuginis TaxID=418750 RepID=A0A918K061_9GAMM|nr:RraA family protein [Saccharospirillum salsuginis]GGX40200.1 S-adenosylmethionine--2-demethylmenaquinone methyltransferase [Saccharospirillum salsuginis]
MPTNTDSLIASYESIATSTLGHLTDDGYLAGITAQTRTQRLLGRARTVRLPPGDGTPIRQALIQSQPGDVLVIDMGDETHRACWGELRTLAALNKGLAGIVTNGCVTDIQAVNDLSFPAFASGISPITTRALGGEGSLDEPIVLAGVTVSSGDVILGDEDGLFACSPRSAEHWINALLERQEWEAGRRHELGLIKA